MHATKLPQNQNSDNGVLAETTAYDLLFWTLWIITIRESHLSALFSFVINLLIFSLKKLVYSFRHANFWWARQKSRGPENLVRGPGNFIVPPPFHFYFNPFLSGCPGSPATLLWVRWLIWVLDGACDRSPTSRPRHGSPWFRRIWRPVMVSDELRQLTWSHSCAMRVCR